MKGRGRTCKMFAPKLWKIVHVNTSFYVNRAIAVTIGPWEQSFSKHPAPFQHNELYALMTLVSCLAPGKFSDWLLKASRMCLLLWLTKHFDEPISRELGSIHIWKYFAIAILFYGLNDNRNRVINRRFEWTALCFASVMLTQKLLHYCYTQILFPNYSLIWICYRPKVKSRE